MLDILKWLPGSRTYILSALFLFVALVLQAGAQGLFVLDPIVRMGLMLSLTIVGPMVPVYIRKAITNLDRDKKGLMPK